MEVIGFVNWQDLSFLANILTLEQQPFTLNYRGNLFPIIVPQQIFWNNFYGFDVGGQSPLLFCLFIISVFIDKFYEYSQDSKFCIGKFKGILMISQKCLLHSPCYDNGTDPRPARYNSDNELLRHMFSCGGGKKEVAYNTVRKKLFKCFIKPPSVESHFCLFKYLEQLN